MRVGITREFEAVILHCYARNANGFCGKKWRKKQPSMYLGPPEESGLLLEGTIYIFPYI